MGLNRKLQKRLEVGDIVIEVARNIEGLIGFEQNYGNTFKSFKLDITDRDSDFKIMDKAINYFGKKILL